MVNFIDKVYIKRDAADSDIARKLCNFYGRERIEIIDDIDLLSINKKKWNIICESWEGSFLKDCPCTPIYRGCNYKVLNLIHNCYLSCTYCILQSYLGGKIIRLFSNYRDVFIELNDFLKKNDKKFFRFGTGELSDSLFIDSITGISRELIRYFSNCNNGVIELKTKTTNIDHLLNENHNGRTIFAWSLNPEVISKSEEKLSPDTHLRIKAAKKAIDKGFYIGFHFDPIIYYEGWEKGYLDVIDMLKKEIDPGKVVWISMGSLRFMPDLIDFVSEEYPQSKIFYSEFVVGLDGKMRYFAPLRKKMYRFIFKNLKEIFPDVPIYFCMESDEFWEEIIGFRPDSDEEAGEYVVSKIRRKLVK